MMRSRSRRLTVRWLPIVLAAAPLLGQSADADFFEKKIRPVLATNCYGCHSSKLKAPMGELVLDTKAGLKKGGASGPAIAAGDPGASLLVRAIRQNDMRMKMPPTGKLPDSVIADFETWIAAGAADPRPDTPSAAAATRHGIDFDKGRQWWAFQPVKELPAPGVKTSDWARRKSDFFVLAKLEQKQIRPSSEADPRVLITRAYLDLAGLKSTYEEVESFANDSAPDRYEKLIDRLLASPRYGERWGRYWLDVVKSMEAAYRMQFTASDVFDLRKEPESVRAEYGTTPYANGCLLARRLVESGVRYVQIHHGPGQQWDDHKDLEKGLRERCPDMDRASAALIRDLKRRGLLDETLVVWGGEFGRTPVSESGNGRDHNPYGFTMWMAGGGVKPGIVYGATDEFGFKAVENQVSIHDLHATVLHQLGLDHEKLTYRYAGRDFRLTDVYGKSRSRRARLRNSRERNGRMSR